MTKYSARLLKALIITTIGVVAVHILLKYISVVVYGEQHGFFFELSNRFDMNDENSVPQWLSQVLFLAIGLSALLAAYLQTKKAAKRLWAIIGALGVLMSLDDVATLHEFILQSVHNTFFRDIAPSLLRNAWFVLLPVILVIAGWLAWQAYRLLPRRTTFLLILAGALFLTGAIFIDSLSNIAPERSFLNQGIFEGIEGGLQLFGISVALYAVSSYIETHHYSKIKAALNQLKT